MSAIAGFISNGLYLIIGLAALVFILMIIVNLVIKIFTHHFSKLCVLILIVSFVAMIGCSVIIAVVFPETLEEDTENEELVENSEETIENDDKEGDDGYTNDQSSQTNNDDTTEESVDAENTTEEPITDIEDEAQDNQEDEETEADDQETLEEEQNKALQSEMKKSIRKPVSYTSKVAKKYGYKLIISNIHKKDITKKYKKLSKKDKKNYRTIKIKEIDTEKHECKIVAGTTKTLESKMKAKFKHLDKNDPLVDAYDIAYDNGYKVIVRNRKGKRIDKKSSFNSAEHVYTSVKSANYDKNSVTFNTDTKAHIKKIKRQKAAAARKRKRQKEKEDFLNEEVIITSGNCYHVDGCYTIRKNKTWIKRREARRRGYTACSKCKPDFGRYDLYD